MPKTSLFGPHLLSRRQHRSNFIHDDATAPIATEFGEMTQNRVHYAIQGHSHRLLENNFFSVLLHLMGRMDSMSLSGSGAILDYINWRE